MKIYERIFNIIGWISFLAILPVALAVFGIMEPQDFLTKTFGYWGSMEFLTIVFFALSLIRVIFGSGEIVSPLIISFIMSFLLVMTAVPAGFMTWYREPVTSLVWFAHERLNLIVGLAILAIGILMSRLKKFPVVIQIIVLIVMPVLFLVLNGIYTFIPF